MKYIRYNESWISKTKSPCELAKFLKRKKNESQKIKYWLLEVTSEGEICREIALNNHNQIIEYAPNDNHRGQWVDSNVTLEISEYKEISHLYFEKLWMSTNNLKDI